MSDPKPLPDSPAEPEPAANKVHPEFLMTELGNAQEFAYKNRGRIVFDHRLERWLFWPDDGHYWKTDDTAKIERMGKKTARSRTVQARRDLAMVKMAAEIATEPEKKKVDPYFSQRLKWAIDSESQARIRSMIGMAESEEGIADSGTRWDQKPNMIACLNGIVDLRTGKLRDGRPDDHISLVARVKYIPTAIAPRWDEFLRATFPDDSELPPWLKRALGYSLTGESSEMVWFLKYGEGRNGKGVIDRVVLDLIGKHGLGVVLPFTALTHESTITEDLADLYRARYAMASEGRKQSKLNEARMKSLTGGDPITANRKFGHNFTFDPTHKLWVSTNKRPTVTDTSYGFWSRVRVIEFKQKFAPNNELEPALRKQREGIFAWLVQGAVEWYRDGLGAVPKAVAAATAAYEEETDSIFSYIQDRCTLGAQEMVGAQALYDDFHAWEVRNNIPRDQWTAHNDFGAAIAAKFTRKHTRSGWVYFGIGLNAV